MYIRKSVLALIAFIGLSAQTPTQKRMKILERTHGKETKKHLPAKKKKGKKKVRVIKKTQRAEGVIVSKGEASEVSKNYQAWKQKRQALEKKARAGSNAAKVELQRHKEIEIHVNRVAKIQALHSYAKRTKNGALMAKAMMLMQEENLRFEKLMKKLGAGSHEGHNH